MKTILDMLPVSEPDTPRIRQWIARYGEKLLERMPEGHFTASGFIFNPARTKTLMVYHNIYQSWAWTGGHADGDADLLRVALREAWEETGVQRLRPIDCTACAADILPVPAHVKHGRPVAAHVHLNLTFALECEEEEALRVKPDENSGVAWIDLKRLAEYVSEQDKDMLPVYEKIIRRYADLR
jgi:8-oxo-dGTP pyrophosphatase MutT (NUDIX family)